MSGLVIVVIVAAVVLVGLVLLGNYLYLRYKNSPDYYVRTHSPRYESSMRNHRSGFLWMSGIAVAVGIVPLADWASFGFRNEWPIAYAEVTDVSGSAIRVRVRHTNAYVTTYQVTTSYTYTVNNQSYRDVVTYNYDDPGSRDQRAASLMGGETIPIWYHSLLHAIHLGSAVKPIYDIVILCIAGFLGIGSLSSLAAMIRLRLNENY